MKILKFLNYIKLNIFFVVFFAVLGALFVKYNFSETYFECSMIMSALSLLSIVLKLENEDKYK